jgi:TorA maturation chaperone TorD
MHAVTMTPMSDLERAASARLLSIGLTCPDEAAVEELRMLAGALAEGAADGSPLRALAEAADRVGVDEMAQAYQDLFGGRVACAPYEASYERDPFRGARQMADVAGFYLAFGAEASGAAGERPDHVGCELEFLAFLIGRRLAAAEVGDVEGAARCAEAEEAFLSAHVINFLAGFATALAEAAEAVPVYRALAGVAAEFAAAEAAARGIAVVPVRRAGASAVEVDEVACGGAGGCSLGDLIGRRGREAGGPPD